MKREGFWTEHTRCFEHLASLLVTMNILAFLFHTVLQRTDAHYRLVRATLPTRIPGPPAACDAGVVGLQQHSPPQRPSRFKSKIRRPSIPGHPGPLKMRTAAWLHRRFDFSKQLGQG